MQPMGTSPNEGRAMSVGGSDGGGSNYETVSAHSVPDSNIEDEYDQLDKVGKEKDELKEGNIRSISDKASESVQPSYVDTLIPSSSGAAASSSAPAAKASASAAISESELDDYKERKKCMMVKPMINLERIINLGFIKKQKPKEIISLSG